jgi:hypothetical protein
VRRGRRQAIGAALAAALAMLIVAPAAAHERGTRAAVRAPQARVDRAEVAALGYAHAEEHAQERARARVERARWNRLTPRQRTRRIAAARRQTATLNRALAERTREDVGYWEPSLIALPEYAIHASMMPTGKILIFGREPLVDGTRSNRGSASVFDPATGTTEHVPPPPIPENPDGAGGSLPAAIFCAGQALLSDGRVLVAGGNLSEPDPGAGRPQYSGLDHTFIFDPWSETWQLGPRMSHGRWYPTMTKLPSGDVIILSGLEEDGQGTVNTRLDIYRPGVPGLTPLAPLPAGERQAPLALYPFMFLLPNADVALAGPGRFVDSAILDTAQLGNAAAGSAWTQIPLTTPSQNHYGGSAVLEPDLAAVDGSWNVLVNGGADSNGGVGHFPARPTVDRLTAGPGDPVWTHDAQDDQRQARFYPNDVLLPDGGIATFGGGLAADYGADANAGEGNYYIGDPPPPELKQVELRRPGERSWRLGAAQQEYRTYHSTAALLPDGRVMSAGDDGHEGPPSAPIPPSVRRDSAEIYWPPYLFDDDVCALRPVIRAVGGTSAPSVPVLTYGERLGIFSEHAQPGMHAVLVAPAAVTHSIDMNQRLVPLAVLGTVAAGGLNVAAPANAALAPPGYYMLFVVDAAGTPSTAVWVRLLAASDPAVAARGDAPETVAGAWAGPRGRSCVNPDGSTRSEPDPQPPGPTVTASSGPAARQTAKLGLRRAAIVRSRRELRVLAAISARASGSVKLVLLAAGRRTRLTAGIDVKRRRIRLQRRIPLAQARVGSGILTISYSGDSDTRPQTARLRVDSRAARLTASRPKITAAGRLHAAGTIRRDARGVVRVQLQYEYGARTITTERSAPIRAGRWKLDGKLAPAIREQIAGRTGTVHSYTLFTGYGPRHIGGEMRSLQVLGDP